MPSKLREFKLAGTILGYFVGWYLLVDFAFKQSTRDAITITFIITGITLFGVILAEVIGNGNCLGLATGAVLLFLHFPIWIIVLYSFTTEQGSFQFPPPGLTTDWYD